MAVDMFLKIEGIAGSSTIKGHEGEIEPLSFSWGLQSSASSSTGGGAGSGKVVPGDFLIVKALDKASPKLFEACCTGKHLQSALLTLSSASVKGLQQDYFKIKLSDVIISSYQTGGSNGGGALPVESLTLRYGDVEISAMGENGNFETITCQFSTSAGAIAHEHDK